jgi:hypothetical protein
MSGSGQRRLCDPVDGLMNPVEAAHDSGMMPPGVPG